MVELRRPVDQDVRERIRTEITRNMCVEAGAGTGKTTIMVARVIEIIRTGYASIDELVVITFTEKAAAELGTRVREALEQALAKAEDPEERERFDRALKSIYRARIETIHAFASSLLRERPVEAELDPNFDVLDTLRADLSFDEQFRTWINQYLDGDDGDDASLQRFRRALNRGLQISHFREICQVVHRRRYLLPLTVQDIPDPDVFAFRERFLGDAAELDELRGFADAGDNGLPQIQIVLNQAERFARARNDRERLERVVLAASKTSANAGAKKNWTPPEACDQQKGIRSALNEALMDIQNQLRAAAIAGILPLAEEFVRAYERQRRQAGQAEFEDLLIWARDLLRDKLHVRADFQQRFRCLLVDEFQDTDPLQVEIVMYLASEGQTETDWTLLRPTEGKLFVVGDPKQSIYRFRRADISIYQQVKEEILHDGLEVIYQNFRSVPEVIGWVNNVFSELIQPQERTQPEYIPLDAFLPSIEPPFVPVVVAHSLEPAKTTGKIREQEAWVLAKMIRQAVEVEGWMVRDEEGGQLRRATYGDVAILMPRRTDIDIYERVFGDARIPFRHEGGKEYFQRQEVRDLRACLRAIDNPGDNLSIVAALRSGAFGYSDRDLYAHQRDFRSFDYRDIGDDTETPIRDGLQTLDRLHKLRRSLTLPEMVERTIEETNLVEFSLLLPWGGDQSAANLLKMVDQARAFSSAGGGGLRAFVRWTVTSSETRSDEADASVAESSDNVVRLMTIHAAKGLEFPIVALANLNSDLSGGNRQGPDVVADTRTRVIDIRMGSQSAGYYKTPGFDSADEREKEHADAEQLRLLYVAATRASDYMILPSAAVPGKAKGLAGSIERFLPVLDDETSGQDVDGVHVVDPATLPPTEITTPAPRKISREEIEHGDHKREEWQQTRAKLTTNGNTALRVVTASSQKRWERASGSEPEIDSPEPAVPAERNQALRIGNALHDAMERIDLRQRRNTEGIVEQSIADAGIQPSDNVSRDRVHRMVRQALESEPVQRAIESSQLVQEVEFACTVPGIDDVGEGLVQGQMDLVFIEDGELVIVDFKSDNISADQVEERTRAHYDGQAAIYAFAARAILDLPVREVIFVYAEPGAWVSLPGVDLADRGKDIARTEHAHLGLDLGETPV